MNDKPQKISIGFSGGQVLSARVAPALLRSLVIYAGDCIPLKADSPPSQGRAEAGEATGVGGGAPAQIE